jgi:choline dehydrogenase
MMVVLHQGSWLPGACWPMNSDARGSVSIKSSDPKEKPAIRFNYLSTDQDRKEWVEAIRCAVKS